MRRTPASEWRDHLKNKVRKMKYLFIGGPHDGYLREVPDNFNTWDLTNHMPLSRPAFEATRPYYPDDALTQHRYRKMQLGEGVKHTVFALITLTPDDVMRRLLSRYERDY